MMLRSAAFHLFRLLALGSVVAAAPAAHAHLGGAYASVEADRTHLSARLQSTVTGTHTVHALALANGGLVREFTRADGTVFAVTSGARGGPTCASCWASISRPCRTTTCGAGRAPAGR